MLLVDAAPLLYAAHYAYPPENRLRGPEGQDTTVCYNFAQGLLTLLRATRPTHLCVVFDPMSGPSRALPPGWTLPYVPNSTSLRAAVLARLQQESAAPGGGAARSWRHTLFSNYKGSRKEPPGEVTSGAEMAQRLLDAAGVPNVEVAGVEADDVIATLTAQAQRSGVSVVIASPDSDFHQLLSDAVTVWSPARGQAGPRLWKQHTPASFRDAHGGLEPWQQTHLKALTGDPTDDIPGVPGIGPVLATQLVQRFSTLDGVLEHASHGDVPTRARKPLNAPSAAKAARLSFDLVQLQSDVDTVTPVLRRPLDVYARGAGGGGGGGGYSRRDVLMAVLGEYGFRSLMGPEVDELLWAESSEEATGHPDIAAQGGVAPVAPF